MFSSQFVFSLARQLLLGHLNPPYVGVGRAIYTERDLAPLSLAVEDFLCVVAAPGLEQFGRADTRMTEKVSAT